MRIVILSGVEGWSVGLTVAAFHLLLLLYFGGRNPEMFPESTGKTIGIIEAGIVTGFRDILVGVGEQTVSVVEPAFL